MSRQSVRRIVKLLLQRCMKKSTKQNRVDSRSTPFVIPSTVGLNIVQQIFQEIQQVPEFSNLFAQGTKIELQDRTIESIVGTFEKYDLTLTRFDVKGEALNIFLAILLPVDGHFLLQEMSLSSCGRLIAQDGDKIIDPFCGTGGFLIYAFEV